MTYSASNHCIESDGRRPVIHAKRVIATADDFRRHFHLRTTPIFRNKCQFRRRATRRLEDAIVGLERPVRLIGSFSNSRFRPKVLRKAEIS